MKNDELGELLGISNGKTEEQPAQEKPNQNQQTGGLSQIAAEQGNANAKENLKNI